MPQAPSIKGGVFGLAVDDVRKLLKDGAISPHQAERWLDPLDFEVLDRPVSHVDWYDVQIYGRLLALLRDVEGKGSNDYLCQRGARSAERLLEAGLYQQLEYLNRTQLGRATDAKSRYEAFGRDLRLLTTVSASILSFSRWASQPDPEYADRYRIEVSQAEAFPEGLVWTSQGFMNRMATQHGEPDLWRGERVRTDLIVYRMIRAL
jgi:hypothetical protein